VHREGDEVLHRLLDAVRAGIVLLGRDGSVRRVNGEARRLLAGRDVAAWEPVTEFLATRDGGSPRTVALDRADGTVHWAEVRAEPLYDDRGEFDGGILTLLDVTARKEVQDALRLSDQKWRSLGASLPDFVVITDAAARILYINQTLPPLSERDILGRVLFEFIDEGERDAYRAKFEEAVVEMRPVRTETRRAPGRGDVWFDVTFVPLVESGSEPSILVVARDVTERKRQEAALRASEFELRALVNSLPDQILVIDTERRILSTNRIHDAHTRSAVIGQLCDTFIEPSMLEEWRRHFHVALTTGEPVHYEMRAWGGPGQVAWYDSVMVPLREEGTVTRLMIVTRNITERRNILARLAEKERLASVGMVAASVAHELMNPLMNVLSNVSHAVTRSTFDQDRLARALDGARRMEQIVGDLRSLGRAGSQELLYVDARSVLSAALRLSGPQVNREARIALNLEEVPGVFASESRLCQVFINLLVNAAQSIEARPPTERQIDVRTRHDDDAGLVAVEIRDNGIGIPPDRLDRIFDPFYTTKPSGTGLGLSISRAIVERMGGRIEVESATGRGSTFTVWLSTTRAPSPPGG